MAQVGIVMGSDSDMPVMAKAADILEELGISYATAKHRINQDTIIIKSIYRSVRNIV